MERLNIEIKLYINNKGTFNLYIINHCFKLHLLTPLILFATLASAILNNLSMAKPPLFINITAPLINITAPFINITASFINIIAPFIKVTAAINYSRDLATLAKIYIEENKYNKKDNNFNYKLIIFNNFYNRVGIPQKAKIKGFLIILYGTTFNFYYKNKATYTTFNNICNAICNYFKGLEYKREVLIK